MTKIKLEREKRKDETLLEDTRAALQLLRKDIGTLRKKLQCENANDVAGSSTIIKQLQVLYTAALDTENRLVKIRDRQAGIAQNGVAFDLDHARAEIGRKLDRLRAAQDAE